MSSSSELCPIRSSATSECISCLILLSHIIIIFIINRLQIMKCILAQILPQLHIKGTPFL